jgi:hypothetical protein
MRVAGSEQPWLSKCRYLEIWATAGIAWNRGRFMSLGLILLIILVVFLLGGFSGRFGGYGYGYGHGGVGVIGTILIVVLVLLLLGRI